MYMGLMDCAADDWQQDVINCVEPGMYDYIGQCRVDVLDKKTLAEWRANTASDLYKSFDLEEALGVI